MTQNYLSFVSWAILAVFIIGAIVLVGMCLYYNEASFILGHPDMFIIEIVALSIIPAISLLIFTYTRGIPLATTAIYAGLLAAKFALIHVLFELSGYYSHVLN